MTSSAIRCKAKDEHGHRCKRKTGHEHFKDRPDTIAAEKHLAFGHTFKGKGHP